MGRIEKAEVCEAHVDHHENIGAFHYHQLKFCINPKSVRHAVRCFVADDAYAHLPKDVWGFFSWFIAAGILYTSNGSHSKYARTLVRVSVAFFLGCAAVTGFYVYLLPAGKTRDAVAGITFGWYLPCILFFGWQIDRDLQWLQS